MGPTSKGRGKGREEEGSGGEGKREGRRDIGKGQGEKEEAPQLDFLATPLTYARIHYTRRTQCSYYWS